MKAGLHLILTLAAFAVAQPSRRHRHVARRQAADIPTVTVVDVVTDVAAVVYVNGNGQPFSTSYDGQAASLIFPDPTSVAPSSAVAPTFTSSRTSPHPPPPPASSSSSFNTPPQATSSLAAPATPSSSPSSSSTPPTTGVGASGYALSYSPYNTDNSCKSQAQINIDFAHISGYSMIRIYGTDCNQTATVGSAAAAYNMKLFAGVYDVTQVETEIQQIITAANGNFDHIDTVAIGNEGVNDGTYSVGQVVSAINTARGLLKSAGYKGKVVTVDTFVAMIANPELCQASDYAAANCHAFFDGGVTAEQAGDFVLAQAQRVSHACGGKDTMITETGWPWQGETNGKAIPSPENQAVAVASIKKAFYHNIVLFTAFNDYWKQNNAGTFGAEQYWGLLGNAPS
ncbi:hypothetical protein LTR62_001687 [Meristemomyces frigidus]|uniref:Uncharacterized protein n=1 Tax=Meristemomyces frigidus TaxID=1508187 RepID=A0AAN7TAT0_9PEZI|nr:hypothetical protein LTR62_001687 [Meristemomyces frigidus]